MSRRTGGGSSGRWLDRQRRDPWARRAREAGDRSRALYKLEQIDRRDRLLHRGQTALDLGAAPGGWSLYLARVLVPDGRVIAVDLLPMKPVEGVDFIRGDFLDPRVRDAISAKLPADGADIVVSDMAPNLSGVKVRDAAACERLAEAVLETAERFLVGDGSMVVKYFEGPGSRELLECFRSVFERVAVRKPDASRAGSAERYLVARGYNGA